MSRKAFIVAPNIGLHMGLGGGVKTALAMARVLEELGYKPYLVALRGYSVRKLMLVHGIKLDMARALYFLGEGGPLNLPFPMQVLLLKIYIEKALARHRPELVVFNDDLPTVDEGLLNNTRVVLYSHFPYAARLKFNVTDAYEVPPSRGRMYLDVLYRRTLEKLIYVNDMYPGATLISNSTVTRIFMRALWWTDPITVNPPLIAPSRASTPSCERGNYVVVLATIQPNKRIGEVIKAFSLVRSSAAKLIIMGHRGPGEYMEYLNRLAKSLGVHDRVLFLTDISERNKWDILMKSKVTVSAAHFEPFGIAVIEGMHANNVPIVYRGPLSGPWIDVVSEGKHGLGFKSSRELAELIDMVLQDYNYMVQRLDPAARAREFSYEKFHERFVRALEAE